MERDVKRELAKHKQKTNEQWYKTQFDFRRKNRNYKQNQNQLLCIVEEDLAYIM